MTSRPQGSKSLDSKALKMYNKLKFRKGVFVMKKTILYILLVGLFVSRGLASYTYEVDTYGDNKTLYNAESILIYSQGGMDGLTLFDESSADIVGTSNLAEGFGGIWYLDLANSSSLNMSGGGVHELNPHNGATVFLAGGTIERIKSSQSAWKQEGNPPTSVWNPHITIECLDHFYNDDTNLLTGHWFDDGTAFSILLIDVDNYSPAIQNIQFVPEPATLSMFGLGLFLLKKRRIS